jgi:hypothetical protein
MKKLLGFLVIVAAIVGAVMGIRSCNSSNSDERKSADLMKTSATQIEQANKAYDSNDYKTAFPIYEALVNKGIRDGVIEYRYAYSKEKTTGLDIQLYQTSLDLLKKQDPQNPYVTSAQKKIANENERIASSKRMHVTLQQLYDDFSANQVAAEAKYADREIEVTIEVGSVTKATLNTAFVNDAYAGSHINFWFTEDNLSDAASLVIGSTVTLIGKAKAAFLVGEVDVKECRRKPIF